MKTFKTGLGQEFTIAYSSTKPSGHGHYKILTEVCSESGELKVFSSVTSDMPSIDSVSELEGQEKWEALFDIIENDIEGEISYWIESIKARF